MSLSGGALALAKSHRFVIRNEDRMFVSHRGFDAFGTYRKYTGDFSNARLYDRKSDATTVANGLTRDYGGYHEVVPVTCVMMEEVQ